MPRAYGWRWDEAYHTMCRDLPKPAAELGGVGFAGQCRLA